MILANLFKISVLQPLYKVKLPCIKFAESVYIENINRF